MCHLLSSTLFLNIIFIPSSNAQLSYTSGAKTHLWGTIEVKDLEKETYAEWYKESQDEFSPKLLSHHYSELQDVTVKIFLGTWCGDTQSFLPKFIKIWEQAGLPINQLKLIALRGEEQYKKGPE
ncbi:MAG: hypothetical protein ACI9FN_002682, partial [Saprospiraceae bacterium]